MIDSKTIGSKLVIYPGLSDKSHTKMLRNAESFEITTIINNIVATLAR